MKLLWQWRSRVLNTFPLAILGAMAVIANARAQITPDDSLGNESSTVTPVNTETVNVDLISGGATRGENLFHSFKDFNISEGGAAYFANPEGIANILSRVTGGNPSNILGRLGVLGNANLFLINPAGILFGENASLDVKGSFFGTTADSVLFGDGFEFSASNPTAPPLLTINIPNGLKFRDNPGDIVNRSIAPDPATNIPVGLQIQPGKNISIIGGDVSLESGGIYASGGRVELGGLNAAGTIGISNDGSLSFPENVERSNVFLRNGSSIQVFSGGGGSIAINSKNLELTEGSALQAGIASSLGSENAQAGDIVINATDKVSFDGVGANGLASGIYNSVFNQSVGNTGKIQITTSDLSFTNGGKILSTLEGTGKTGNIIISANNNISIDGTSITNTGIIDSTVVNSIFPTGSGSTGNINISAKNLSLTNGASINSFNGGKGTSGNINIDASDTIFVDGSLEPFVSKISSYVDLTGTGDAGVINLNSNNLVVTNGGTIGSLTSGKGNSGNIKINARNNISLDGESKVNNAPPFSNIITSVPGEGNSGNIDINTQNLSLTNGAFISSRSLSKGNAGDINITATNSVSVDGQGSSQGSFSNISSGLNQGAIGDEGNIKVTTGRLRLSNSGGIFGSTEKGNGASITIEAKEEVFLDRGNIDSSLVQIFTSPEQQNSAEGNGGDISITAKNVSLINNSFLTSFSTAKGDGGDIRIDATEKVSLDRSSISTIVFGGNVSDPNTGININLFGEGNSGNIDIKSGQILLDNNSKIATNNAGIGNAGNIFLEANDIFSAANGSIISSNIGQENGTPAAGKVGNIGVSAKNVALNNGTELSAGFFSNTEGESASISVKATDNISFNNSSGIFTGVASGAIANGSDINLEANSISITNNSKLVTSILGVGKAGNVTVNANDRFSLDGSSIFSTVEAGGEGNGGQIKIDTGNLDLTKGSQILTSVRQAQNNLPGGIGNAGNIIINARGDVKLDGILNVSQTSGIGSELETGAKGKAGNIEISSNSLSLINNAILSSQTFGIGDAGNITINAVDRVSSDRSKIFSQVRDTGRGRGGNIAIATKNLSLTNGSQLFNGVFGIGDAGNVTINASDTISLDGRGSDGFFSGIFSTVERSGQGNGGNVNVDTENLVLTNGGQLSTQSFGIGNGGNIKINVDSLAFDRGSSILASNTPSETLTTDLGGGNIELNINDRLVLRNNSNISAQANQNANGGNVNINAPNRFIIAFPNQNNDITANASQGKGGNINLTAQSIFGLEERPLNPFTNDINASSEFGLQGNISINTPDIDPSRGLIELPQTVTDPNDQIAQNPCQRGADSEFIVTGKGGIPPNPNDNIDRPEVRVSLIDPIPTEAEMHKGKDAEEKISSSHPQEKVPARGWIFTDDGKVMLTAIAPSGFGSGDRRFWQTPTSCPAP